MKAEFMVVRSNQGGNDYDQVATTGISLVIAVMVIASLPLILGMVVWLPGWLEHAGLATAPVAGF